jgi:hypothetical protein
MSTQWGRWARGFVCKSGKTLEASTRPTRFLFRVSAQAAGARKDHDEIGYPFGKPAQTGDRS